MVKYRVHLTGYSNKMGKVKFSKWRKFVNIGNTKPSRLTHKSKSSAIFQGKAYAKRFGMTYSISKVKSKKRKRVGAWNLF